jgi:hypothetical protein
MLRATMLLPRVLVAMTVLALFVFPPAATPTCGTTPAYAYHVPCCKYCWRGKACGNTCIARWKTCHVGHGCACDASRSTDRLVLLPGGHAVE